MNNPFLMELKNISKTFPGVKALSNVNLNLLPGEVHVVMGENGAGKSTLMKIINGVYKQEEGEIFLDTYKVDISSPKHAQDKGIAMIHQELNVVMDLTVGENIFLGRELGTGILVNIKKMKSEAEELLSSLGIQIPVNVNMRDLSIANMQMVEIAKALSQNARIIIMDEPTSAITDSEVAALFKMIRDLKKKGVGIFYISHKMNEIFQIADRITVLRDGSTVGTYKAAEIDNSQLISLMVGRDIGHLYPLKNSNIGETVLKVEKLSFKGRFEDISFELHKGEILGVAGLMGAGRSELAEAIFGTRKATSGNVIVRNKRGKFSHPKSAIKHGLAMVTEDRKRTGLNLCASVKEEMSIVCLDDFCIMKQIVQTQEENIAVDNFIKKLKVKTPFRNQKIVNLSGGNQQKVIIARWLMANPNIIILDEPTRGIDVGAKFEIYSLIMELAAAGKAILMISSELQEIVGICDRTIVLHEGKLAGILNKENMTQENIMTLATGQGRFAI